MQTTVYIAVSVDGFIAKPDGDIKWLENPAYLLEGEDYGWHGFIESVDGLVMGRNSYEKVRSFDIDWPYTQPVIVLTTRPLDVPADLTDKIIVMGGAPADILNQAAAQGFQHLYLDGGVTIQHFLKAGLVDRLILTRIPILLGGGIPLFGELPTSAELTLLSTKGYANGFVQTTYAVEYNN